jgi:hypothetical protein
MYEYHSNHKYSTFLVLVPSEVISLQLYTLKVPMYDSSYTQSIIYI